MSITSLALLQNVAPTPARLAEVHAYMDRPDGMGATLRDAGNPAVATAFAFLQTRPVPFYRRMFREVPDQVRVTHWLRLVGNRQVRDIHELEAAWRCVRHSSDLPAKVNLALQTIGTGATLAKASEALAHVESLWNQDAHKLSIVLEALRPYRTLPWFDRGWWVVAEALMAHAKVIESSTVLMQYVNTMVIPGENDPHLIAQALEVVCAIRPLMRARTIVFFRNTAEGISDTRQRLDTLRAVRYLSSAQIADLSQRAIAGTPRGRHSSAEILRETTEDDQRRHNVQADIAQLKTLLCERDQISAQRAVAALRTYIASPQAEKLSRARVKGIGDVKSSALLALQNMVERRASALATLGIVWSIIEAPDLGDHTPSNEARGDMRYALVSALARVVKHSGGDLVCANGQNQRFVAALYGHGFGLLGEADQLRATPAELVCALTGELARKYPDHPPREACIAHYKHAVRRAQQMYANNAEHLAVFGVKLHQAYRALEWSVPGDT